jgi:hypothetical protein
MQLMKQTTPTKTLIVVADRPRPTEPGLYRDPGPNGAHRGRLLADGLGAGQCRPRHAFKVLFHSEVKYDLLRTDYSV